MSQILKLATSFLATGLLFCNLIFAQETFSVGLWQEGVGFLGYVQVRDELMLTADQMAKLKELGDELIKDRPTRQQQAGLTKEEREKKAAAFKARQQEVDQKAKAVLTAEQAARMKQIEFWIRGPSTFIDADVALEQELTDEQKGALKTIVGEYSNKMAEIRQSFAQFLRKIPTKDEVDRYYSDEEVAKRKAKQSELREMSETQCLAVLTDEQKVRFGKMRGRKFELGELVPRRN
jgi:Spy/CpxP family protein refolding chaperone